MPDDQEKIAYNSARQKALQQLARNHPEEYETLVERYLKRPLDKRGRTLTHRVRTGEQRRSS